MVKGALQWRLGCDEAPLRFPDLPEHHVGHEHPMTAPVGVSTRTRTPSPSGSSSATASRSVMSRLRTQ